MSRWPGEWSFTGRDTAREGLRQLQVLRERSRLGDQQFRIPVGESDVSQCCGHTAVRSKTVPSRPEDGALSAYTRRKSDIPSVRQLFVSRSDVVSCCSCANARFSRRQVTAPNPMSPTELSSRGHGQELRIRSKKGTASRYLGARPRQGGQLCSEGLIPSVQLSNATNQNTCWEISIDKPRDLSGKLDPR